MTGIKSRDYINKDYEVYGQFMGMDRSRARTAMDTNKAQHLWLMENAYCDWRGRIVRDAPAKLRISDTRSKVKAIRFQSRMTVCWAHENDAGISLQSDRDHELVNVYPRNTPVSFVNFRNKAIVFAPGQLSYTYDGSIFREMVNSASHKAAFGAVTSNRLAIAGMPNKPTEVWLSRVRDETMWPLDEDAGSTNKAKAIFIDVQNLIDTADAITGLGSFETNRLAIFAQDQTLLYKTDEDYTKVVLDENANIKVGCVSHRTIKQASGNLIFCSRYGVHVIRRSDVNGIYVAERMLSTKIEDLYREYVKSVSDKRDINACYDPDSFQYHIFFPQNDGLTCKRMTLTLRDIGTKAEVVTWSVGTFLNARCADSLGGQFVVGTPGGVYNMLDRVIDYDALALTPDGAEEVWPPYIVDTPVLWLGSAIETKQTKELTLQATGDGKINILIYDEDGRKLGEREVTITAGSNEGEFPGLSLDSDYRIPFMYRFRGVQLRFFSEEPGKVAIIGFSIDRHKGA